eukprot:scaffold20603_cov56-Isochrysis_galbana.AAC.1
MAAARPVLSFLFWWPAAILAVTTAATLLASRRAPPSGIPATGAWVPMAVAELARGAREEAVEEAMAGRMAMAGGGERAAGMAAEVVRQARHRLRGVQ